MNRPKLRILQLTEAASAGVGRHVIDLCGGLLDQGHSVALAYSRLRVSATFLEGVAALQKRSGRFQQVPLAIRRWPSWQDWSSVRAVRRAFPEPLDIVHAHSTKAGFLSRLLMRSIARAAIYSPHAPLSMSAANGRLLQRGASAMELALSYRCDRIICVSVAERKHLLGIGIDPGKLEVVENGVPPATSLTPDADAAFKVQGSGLSVGFVGRLAKQKGVDILLEALRRMDPSIRAQFTVFIFGDGPERQRLETTALELQLGSCVRWMGDQPAETLIGSFDMLVLPSRYEGMPYVLLEAQRAAVPVIATNVGGVNELLGENDAGIIIPPEDPTALALALEKMVQDPTLRNECGVRGQARSAHYDLRRMVGGIEAVYYRSLA